MKSQKLIVLLALILFTPTLTNAQFGNLIRNKASKALNSLTKGPAKEAADSTALKNGTTSANDSIAKLNQGKQSPNQQGQMPAGMNLSNLFGGKVDLKHKDEYSFTSRLYMVMETYHKKETMNMDLYMYFSSNSSDVGIESKTIANEKGKTTPVNSFTVMDGENKCFIILVENNGSNMAMISAIPDEHAAAANQGDKPVQKTAHGNFSKTGNTRIIAGYNCDEYTYTDSEKKTNSHLWFTKEANLKIDRRGWQKTEMGAYYGYEGFEGGMFLAMESYDENGKLTMKSETKEISPNFDHSVSLKGVTFMQMNLNQRQR